jgi:hypothetical protein
MLNHHPDGGEIIIGSGSGNVAGSRDVGRDVASESTWEKLAFRSGDSGGSGGGFERGDAVTWAYKRAATPFDLLYLYGFVSEPPSGEGTSGEVVSVDLRWEAPSPEAFKAARRLFGLVVRACCSQLLCGGLLQGHIALAITYYFSFLLRPSHFVHFGMLLCFFCSKCEGACCSA